MTLGSTWGAAMHEDQLIDLYYNRILSGEQRPGSVLPTKRLLAEEGNCSVTAAKLALKALADAGLIYAVTVQGQRRWAVAYPSEYRQGRVPG